MKQPTLKQLDNRDRIRLLKELGQPIVNTEALVGTDSMPVSGQYVVLQEDDGEID